MKIHTEPGRHGTRSLRVAVRPDQGGHTVMLPIKTVSEANTRCHYYRRHKRTKRQRKDAGLLIRAMLGMMKLPLRITLTRIAPRKLDGDNLASSLKAVRDGIADGLGLKDDKDSDKLIWSYSQRPGSPGEYGVEVRVERL